jgi:hypothetical protein
MKENIKWAIFGGCIIVSVIVYVIGTRYQGVATSGGFVVYDRMTGDRK